MYADAPDAEGWATITMVVNSNSNSPGNPGSGQESPNTSIKPGHSRSVTPTTALPAVLPTNQLQRGESLARLSEPVSECP